MAKRDILEMQKRMKKDANNITWIVTCLIEPDGEIKSVHKQRLASMREEEYFKYLAKIKQVFAGKKYGDAVMQVETDGYGIMTNTMGKAIGSEMKDDDVIYDIIKAARESIKVETRHVVIIWQDIYDIIAIDKNREKLDESEETLNYIGVVVCPVSMDGEGLVYNGKTEGFEAKERQWVMRSPGFACMWPSLVNHRPDEDVVTMYFENPAAPDHRFTSEYLGCKDFFTRTEIQEKFERAIQRSTETEEEKADALGRIHYKLENMDQDKPLSAEDVRSVCQMAGIPDYIADKIRRNYDAEFPEPQRIEDLYVQKHANRYAAIVKAQQIKQTLNKAADAIDEMSGSGELTVDIRRVAAGL